MISKLGCNKKDKHPFCTEDTSTKRLDELEKEVNELGTNVVDINEKLAEAKEVIQTKDIGTARLTADLITANTVVTSNLDLANVITPNIASDTITTGTATITNETVENSVITKAEITEANIVTADITNLTNTSLESVKVEATEIEADKATIADETVTKSTITEATITDATITNSTIETSTIKDATIANLTVTDTDVTMVNLETENISAEQLQSQTEIWGIEKIERSVNPGLNESSFVVLPAMAGTYDFVITDSDNLVQIAGHYESQDIYFNQTISFSAVTRGLVKEVSVLDDKRAILKTSLSGIYNIAYKSESKELCDRIDLIAAPDPWFDIHGSEVEKTVETDIYSGRIIHFGDSTNNFGVTIKGELEADVLVLPPTFSFENLILDGYLQVKGTTQLATNPAVAGHIIVTDKDIDPITGAPVDMISYSEKVVLDTDVTKITDTNIVLDGLVEIKDVIDCTSGEAYVQETLADGKTVVRKTDKIKVDNNDIILDGLVEIKDVTNCTSGEAYVQETLIDGKTIVRKTDKIKIADNSIELNSPIKTDRIQGLTEESTIEITDKLIIEPDQVTIDNKLITDDTGVTITADLVSSGALTQEGVATFQEGVSFLKNITVTGEVESGSVNTDSLTAGPTTIVGDVGLTGDLTQTGDQVITGNVDISNDLVLEGTNVGTWMSERNLETYTDLAQLNIVETECTTPDILVAKLPDNSQLILDIDLMLTPTIQTWTSFTEGTLIVEKLVPARVTLTMKDKTRGISTATCPVVEGFSGWSTDLNIDDNITSTTSAWSSSLVNTKIVNSMLPIGSVLLVDSNTFDPNTQWGGTWTQLAYDGYYLATGSSVGANGSQSLPNITGNINMYAFPTNFSCTGAFSYSNGQPFYLNWQMTPASGAAPTYKYTNLNSSRSSSIYQDNAAVKPRTYYIKAWKRTA